MLKNHHLIGLKKLQEGKIFHIHLSFLLNKNNIYSSHTLLNLGSVNGKAIVSGTILNRR